MDKYLQIESYIMNALSKADKIDFEKRLSHDEELSAELDSHVKMKVGLNEFVKEDVIDVIDSLRVESNVDNHEEAKVVQSDANINRRISRHKFIGIAASILVLFFVGWSWLLPMNENEIFEKYYKSPIIEDTRSGEKEDIGRIEKEYFEAHILVAQKKYQESITAFNSIDLPENHYLIDNIEWFTSLIGLKIDNRNAVISFKEMAKIPNHKYSKEIQSLLHDLKE